MFDSYNLIPNIDHVTIYNQSVQPADTEENQIIKIMKELLQSGCENLQKPHWSKIGVLKLRYKKLKNNHASKIDALVEII